MRIPRPAFTVMLAALLLAARLGAQTPRPEFRVTLLGIGAPPMSMTRFGPSTLVEVGGQTLVFDVGRGAAQRLGQLGVSFARIDAVFLTHLHSDRVVGLPDLWLSGWILDRRTTPWPLLGPAGTAALAAHLTEAFAFDIGLRTGNGRQSAEGGRLDAHDIAPGIVYDHRGVRVVAFAVDHAPIEPAYAYRIEHAGRVLVLSGDTRYAPALITAARGADLLVHEVALAPPDVDSSAPYYRAFVSHTTPEQAAAVFTQVHPTLAVFAHIVQFGGGRGRSRHPTAHAARVSRAGVARRRLAELRGW